MSNSSEHVSGTLFRPSFPCLRCRICFRALVFLLVTAKLIMQTCRVIDRTIVVPPGARLAARVWVADLKLRYLAFKKT